MEARNSMHLARKYEVLHCSWSHHFEEMARDGVVRGGSGEKAEAIQGFS